MFIKKKKYEALVHERDNARDAAIDAISRNERLLNDMRDMCSENERLRRANTEQAARNEQLQITLNMTQEEYDHIRVELRKSDLAYVELERRYYELRGLYDDLLERTRGESV